MHTCQKSNITGRALTVLGFFFRNHSIGPARNAPHSGRMDRDLSDKVTGFHGNGKALKYNNDEKKLMICSRFPNPKLAVGKRFSKWIVSPGPMCSKTIILLTATGNLGSELPSRLGMSRATSQTYHLLWSDLLTLGKKIGQFVKLVRKQNVPWEFVIPRE